ncbi:O-methyltransferase [Colletotrichum cuscutae]|uniref:O-methyltransferase n=1 Tax=Colletotrichum cuscutae TaxID=1209917 RepID=A0AAI9XFN9_9PEZI|nr:O-methyltransferase [Colletotrichum cuscutae]
MKSSVSVLYPNESVSRNVTTYSESRSTDLPAHIIAYHDHIDKTQPETSMLMISNFQAQNHIWIAKLIGAKRSVFFSIDLFSRFAAFFLRLVLEIGVYVGYSGMVWSHAVGPEGTVTGLEFSADYAKQAEEAWAANGIKNASVVVGDALETATKPSSDKNEEDGLPTLNPSEPYDLIFIDAQKSGYPSYLSTILATSQKDGKNRLLRAGGLIVADNVLRRGIVADDSDENPWVQREKGERAAYWKSEDVDKLREFNSAVHDEPRLDSWLMPLYDGVHLARLVD